MRLRERLCKSWRLAVNLPHTHATKEWRVE